MPITAHLLTLIIAITLFVVSGLGVGTGRFSLIAFGLAFLALAAVFP